MGSPAGGAGSGIAMTTADLIRVLGRRCYILALCLVMTAAVAVKIHHRAGVFWSQTDVVFVAPATPRQPNTIEANASGLVSIAGYIAAEMNKGLPSPLTASAGATLVGQGVRDGYEVQLPNSGGQWAVNFDRPVLDIEVVAPTPDETRRRMVALVASINQILRVTQDSDGVAKKSQITTLSAPDSAQVFAMDGNPTRAAAVAMLLGLWLSILLTIAFDRLVRRLRARPRARNSRLATA
jgi:hypothetical protein